MIQEAIITDAVTNEAKGRVWYVTRHRSIGSGTRHTVRFVRKNGVRRWMCDCEDFFNRHFEAKTHCDHIKRVKAYTGRNR